MKESDNWYTNKPLRIAAIQYGQNPEDTMKVPALLEQGGFNVEQALHVIGRQGYALYSKEEHESTLKAYLQDCAERGIHVILYANAHMMEADVFNRHLDWAQRNRNNTPAIAYGNYVLACMNSPWRDSFLASIRDALEQDISGLFLDGPLFIADGCHCEHCHRLFTEQFGHPMEEASHRELTQFKSRHVARLLKDVRELITESKKKVVLYANSIGLAENITGCDIDTVFPYVDLIGSEGGFLFYGDPNEVSIWRGALCTKYLAAKAQGKPYVVFCASNHQPWARHMHTAAETTQLFTAVVANGGNVWYGIHGLIDGYASPGGQTALAFNRFLAKNEAYFENTVPCADVALVWSSHTINTFRETVNESDFTRADCNTSEKAIGSFQKEFSGIADMLFRHHVQFSLIDETGIENGELKNYQTVILPNTLCMDDTTVGAVCDYVKNGGNLIATLASGLFDQDGERRDTSPFQTLFHQQSDGETVHYEFGCGYLEYGDEKHGIDASGKNTDNNIVAGFTSPVLRYAYEADATVLASSFFPMEGRYSAFCNQKFPSIVTGSYGSGRFAYCAGGLGETYSDFGIPDMKTILLDLVDRFTTSPLRIENAYQSIEVELRTQPQAGRYLLHFVNHTGYMRRPVEELIPCKEIKVTFRTKATAKRVHALYSLADIPFEQKDGAIHFTASVKDYELIAIETE